VFEGGSSGNTREMVLWGEESIHLFTTEQRRKGPVADNIIPPKGKKKEFRKSEAIIAKSGKLAGKTGNDLSGKKKKHQKEKNKVEEGKRRSEGVFFFGGKGRRSSVRGHCAI